MWGGRAGLVVAVAAIIEACSLVKPTTPPVVGGRQEGVASWYGPGFHGRRTANGEIYDQYELTAAHQTLPLGTRVMVTSLTNARSVEVRINDRGPFVGGRIVDLSYAAASVLGMVGPGTMPVRLDVLDAAVEVASSRPTPPVALARRREVERPRGELAAVDRARDEAPTLAAGGTRAEPAVATSEPAGTYNVVVATLSDQGMAEHLRSRIAIKFADAHVSRLDVGTGRLYRVHIGPYPTRGVALARAEQVNRYGYPAVITAEAIP
jgi:rare lipoprotein A